MIQPDSTRKQLTGRYSSFTSCAVLGARKRRSVITLPGAAALGYGIGMARIKARFYSPNARFGPTHRGNFVPSRR